MYSIYDGTRENIPICHNSMPAMPNSARGEAEPPSRPGLNNLPEMRGPSPEKKSLEIFKSSPKVHGDLWKMHEHLQVDHTVVSFGLQITSAIGCVVQISKNDRWFSAE